MTCTNYVVGTLDLQLFLMRCCSQIHKAFSLVRSLLNSFRKKDIFRETGLQNTENVFEFNFGLETFVVAK